MKQIVLGSAVATIVDKDFLVAFSMKFPTNGKAVCCTVGQAHYKVKSSPVEINYLGTNFYLKVENGKIENVTEGSTGRAVVRYKFPYSYYSEKALQKVYLDLKAEIRKHGEELLHKQIVRHSAHNILPVIFTL